MSNFAKRSCLMRRQSQIVPQNLARVQENVGIPTIQTMEEGEKQ